MTKPPSRLGTFQGVFRPTTLTILGALLYLREGWLVGSVGLLGAIGVLVAATLITGTTALSVSTIATNQRMRPGGAFAIIGQSLGLEAGGAIGGPLYVAQALSSAMYAYAFAEALRGTVTALGGPDLPLVPTALIAFIAIAALAMRSAALAVKAQGALFVLAAVALVSFFSGVFTSELHAPELLPPPEAETSLLAAFALFFPATTGIMVGVGMSGQLGNPQRAIPRGTLWAWAVTTALYLLAAVWYSIVATQEELLTNPMVAFDHALLGWVVRAGLLASTLMAALSSLVASSQLLRAMASEGVVPTWLARLGAGGEPQVALAVTAGVAGAGLLTGGLDAIAPIITAFFLLTYVAVNGVVLLEQRLGMISFRPTFAVPSVVPLVGLAASATALVLASPRPVLLGGLVGLLALYLHLTRKDLTASFETVRSGIPVAIASWAARRASAEGRTMRAWRPEVLLAVPDASESLHAARLARAIAGPHGSVRLMATGVHTVPPSVQDLAARLVAAGTFTTTLAVSSARVGDSLQTALEAMQGDLFPPNLVLLDVAQASQEEIRATHEACRALHVGLGLFVDHVGEHAGGVDVWLSDRSPDWKPRLHDTNLDLPALVAWLVAGTWGAPLRLVTAVRKDPEQARAFLRQVASACRLPAKLEVEAGPFHERLRARPAADLHIFGMPLDIQRERLIELTETAGGPCLFLMDSGKESAFA
jgi:amino acid transporter